MARWGKWGVHLQATATECTPSFACRCIALLSRMPLDWHRSGHQTKQSLLESGRAFLAHHQAAWYGNQSAAAPPRPAHRATFATCHSASTLCAASSPEDATQSPSTAAKCPWIGLAGVDNLQASPSAADERPAAARASDVVAASKSLFADGTQGFPQYDVSDLDSRTLASIHNVGCEARLSDSSSGDSQAVQQRRPDTSVPGLFLGELFVSAVSRY